MYGVLDVAVKCLSIMRELSLEQFMYEIENLWIFSLGDNIVQFRGCVIDSEAPALVSIPAVQPLLRQRFAISASGLLKRLRLLSLNNVPQNSVSPQSPLPSPPLPLSFSSFHSPAQPSPAQPLYHRTRSLTDLPDSDLWTLIKTDMLFPRPNNPYDASIVAFLGGEIT